MKKDTIEKILLDFKSEEVNLLPALKKISVAFGHLDERQAQKIADYFSLPLSQVFETGSFYDEIKFEKQPETLIEICSGPDCAVSGSLSLIQEVESYFKIRLDDNSGAKVKLRTMSCVGRCMEGPALRINGKIYSKITKDKLHNILESCL